MANLHYFPFYPSYWRSARVANLKPPIKAIFIDLLCEIYNESMELLNNDEEIANTLRVPVKEWLVAREELLREPKPLIYIDRNNYIQNIELNSAYENAKKVSDARKAAVQAREAKKLTS